SELLAHPTVLELESIGNDDEKTFLMGLLLARLYGYRRLQAAKGSLPKGLQHILVFEEAHRLLKNVGTQVATDAANLRAQAIETFVNMLSEVRHYGQGVLVAEQIPSKLTPDVVKNTNLKLVHRLLAQDDRESLGQTMNMTEPQMRRLTTLRAGEAVAYAEGDDHPFLLSVTDFKKRFHLHMPTDQELSALSRHYISLAPYLLTPDIRLHGLRPTRFDGLDAIIYEAVLYHLNQGTTQAVWARLIARTVFNRAALPAALQQLRQQIAAQPRHLTLAQHEEALETLLVLGVFHALHARGAQRGWSYALVDSLRLPLTAGLLKLARTGELKEAATELDRFARTYEFQSKRRWGPYPGCEACRAICFFHAEVTRLFSPIDQGQVRATFANPAFKTEDERYQHFGKQMKYNVRQWLGGEGKELSDLAYCAALVAASRLSPDEYEQSHLGIEIAKRLL
ncbi:MAG: ATP-binding protein, partial [Ardenticatenales bacterium]|nr:ATP-binding protein [Ardenticatenales bacterium]